MAIAERQATTTWQGDLATGAGTTTSGTGAFGELPVTWASRTERADGKTSPEELIAAAHASCFSMALSAELGKANLKPASIETKAALTLEKLDVGFTTTRIHLEVTASVPGASNEAFLKASEDAKRGCPISRLLNTTITVEAKLA